MWGKKSPMVTFRLWSSLTITYLLINAFFFSPFFLIFNEKLSFHWEKCFQSRCVVLFAFYPDIKLFSPDLILSSWYGVWLRSTWISYQWGVRGRAKKLPWIYLPKVSVIGKHWFVSCRISIIHGAPFFRVPWWHISFDCQKLQPFYRRSQHATNWEVHSWMGESACPIR